MVLHETCVIGVDNLLDELGMLFCVFLASAADRYNNLSCVYCWHWVLSMHGWVGQETWMTFRFFQAQP